MTETILEAQRNIRSLEAMYRHSELIIHKQLYAEQVKNVSGLIKEAKRTYYLDRLLSAESSQKELFSSVP